MSIFAREFAKEKGETNYEREEKEQEKDLADHGGGFHAGEPKGGEAGGDR